MFLLLAWIWMLEIMDHLWLWYDYSCLPQRKIRKEDDYLKNVFDRSLLAHLPVIQSRTVPFYLSLEESYYTRPWCFSEYIPGSGAVQGRSEMGHSRNFCYPVPAAFVETC